MQPEIRNTRDGSTTLFSDRFGQHYHNPNGAVAESLHVFFETPGLIRDIQNRSALRLFETGFGTGLNLLLFDLLLNACHYPHQAEFISVEAWPVSADTVSGFSFGAYDELTEKIPLLEELFSALTEGWNEVEISDRCNLKLYVGTIEQFFHEEVKIREVDYFLHDPFSPEVNPELWQADLFCELHKMAKPQAIISTYCAASSARAAMAVAGWFVAIAPGALGKREMTVASPDPGRLTPYKRVNEKRLAERYSRGDFPVLSQK